MSKYRRRLMMAALGGGAPQPIVPTGYTQVEYVTVNGSGYINTGYASMPENQSALFIDMQATTVKTQARLIAPNASNTSPQMYINGSSGLGYRLRNNWAAFSGFTFDTNRHQVEVDWVNRTVRVDSQTASMGSTPNTASNSNPLLICGPYSTQDRYVGRIYSAWIKRNGVLVRNYVMCRDDNNVPYAYDRVNETITAFSGSGTTVGPDVVL